MSLKIMIYDHQNWQCSEQQFKSTSMLKIRIMQAGIHLPSAGINLPVNYPSNIRYQANILIIDGTGPT